MVEMRTPMQSVFANGGGTSRKELPSSKDASHRDTFGPGDAPTESEVNAVVSRTNNLNLKDDPNAAREEVLDGSTDQNKYGKSNGRPNGGVPAVAVITPSGTKTSEQHMPGGPWDEEEQPQRPGLPTRPSRSYRDSKPEIVTQYSRPLDDVPLPGSRETTPRKGTRNANVANGPTGLDGQTVDNQDLDRNTNRDKDKRNIVVPAAAAAAAGAGLGAGTMAAWDKHDAEKRPKPSRQSSRKSGNQVAPAGDNSSSKTPVVAPTPVPIQMPVPTVIQGATGGVQSPGSQVVPASGPNLPSPAQATAANFAAQSRAPVPAVQTDQDENPDDYRLSGVSNTNNQPDDNDYDQVRRAFYSTPDPTRLETYNYGDDDLHGASPETSPTSPNRRLPAAAAAGVGGAALGAAGATALSHQRDQPPRQQGLQNEESHHIQQYNQQQQQRQLQQPHQQQQQQQQLRHQSAPAPAAAHRHSHRPDSTRDRRLSQDTDQNTERNSLRPGQTLSPSHSHQGSRLAPIAAGIAVGDVATLEQQHHLQGQDSRDQYSRGHQLVDRGPVRAQSVTSGRRSAFGHRPQPVLIEDGYQRPESRSYYQQEHRQGLIGRSNTVGSRAQTLGRNGTLSRASNGGTIGRRAGAFGHGAGLSVGTQPEEILGRE